MTTPEDHTPQDFDMATLDAAIASLTPEQQQDELHLADQIALGLTAFALGEEYLGRGDLTGARRWLSVAARHDAPGAQDLLADVDMLVNAVRTPEIEHTAAGTALQSDPDAAEAERVDTASILLDAATTMRMADGLLQRSRDQAKRTIDDAHTRADRILTEARHKAENVNDRTVNDAIADVLLHVGRSQRVGQIDADLMRLYVALTRHMHVVPAEPHDTRRKSINTSALDSVNGSYATYTGRWARQNRQRHDSATAPSRHSAFQAAVEGIVAIVESCRLTEQAIEAARAKEEAAQGPLLRRTALTAWSAEVSPVSPPLLWRPGVVDNEPSPFTETLQRWVWNARLAAPTDASLEPPAPREELTPGPQLCKALDKLGTRLEPTTPALAG